jgi:hypothetical protein
MLTLELRRHCRAVTAHAVAIDVRHEGAGNHLEAIEGHPRVMEAHSGAPEAQPGVLVP